LPSYDVHQHLWPEPFIDALSRRSAPPCLDGRVLRLPGELDSEADFELHELETRLRLLDRDGIDVALISLPPAHVMDPEGELAEVYHESVLELVATAGGRVQALASGACREGFAGACVSADSLVSGLDPLLEELGRVGQLLFVHPGPPRGFPPGAPLWWGAVVEYTAQMQAAYAIWLARDAERFPSIPVIFSILAGGAPIQLERMRSRGFDDRSAIRANVFFDTSSYGRRALELCLSTFGVNQLVYGSDVPVIDPEPTLQAVRQFGEAVERIVMRETPGRLLDGLR
jgi:6-methylsalicylate decarboxylase